MSYVHKHHKKFFSTNYYLKLLKLRLRNFLFYGYPSTSRLLPEAKLVSFIPSFHYSETKDFFFYVDEIISDNNLISIPISPWYKHVHPGTCYLYFVLVQRTRQTKIIIELCLLYSWVRWNKKNKAKFITRKGVANSYSSRFFVGRYNTYEWGCQIINFFFCFKLSAPPLHTPCVYNTGRILPLPPHFAHNVCCEALLRGTPPSVNAGLVDFRELETKRRVKLEARRFLQFIYLSSLSICRYVCIL